jgi:ribose transport system ATP-binding protein
LPREEIGEASIVGAFLRSRQAAASSAAGPPGGGLSGWLTRLVGRGASQWWMPLIVLGILTLAVGLYAARRTDVFLTALNIRHILLAAAPLALVTMAQFTVLMVRGFDMSVGALMSVVVVAASFLLGADAGPGAIVLGALLCLRGGRGHEWCPGAHARHQPCHRHDCHIERVARNRAVPAPLAGRRDQR